MKTQVILTGVSGSGKTTLMNNLIDGNPKSYGIPLQYTTRQQRSDKELDSYIFLTKPQFYKKLENGDFIEFTEYNGQLYAVGKYFNQDVHNIFIVEPVGKASLTKYFEQNNIPFKSFYLELELAEARRRMIERGENSKNIEKRLEDFKYFHPMEGDVILDGTTPTNRLSHKVDVHLGVL